MQMKMLFFEQFSESMSNYENGLSPQNLFERIHFATLGWQVPLGVAVVYAIIVSIWGWYNKTKVLVEEPRVKAKALKKGTTIPVSKTSDRFSVFNCLVIAHNVFLTIFSLYCFICIVGILVDSYMNNTFHEAYCDKNLKQFYAGVNYLVWLFYLSKYYELLDTFILLIKGKPSSFLQTFHHSGSILSLWTMCITRIPGMWIFTFLNSFIHTLMYFYFTLTCLGYRPTWKRHLTTMQISQFLIGNVFGFAYMIIPDCYNWNHNFRENIIHKILGSHRSSIVACFTFNFLFVGTLIILFNDFARRTYGQKQKNNKNIVAGKEAKKDEDEDEREGDNVEALAVNDEKKKKKQQSSKLSKIKESPNSTSTLISDTKTKKTQRSARGKSQNPAHVLEPELIPIKSSVKAVKGERAKSRARSVVRSKSKSKVRGRNASTRGISPRGVSPRATSPRRSPRK